MGFFLHMLATRSPRLRAVCSLCQTLILLLVVTPAFGGEEYARLRKISVKPRPSSTRLFFKLSKTAEYSVSILPSQRLRLTFKNADSPFFKKLRNYSDQHIGGVTVSQHGEDLLVTVAVKGDVQAWQLTELPGADTLTLDIGPRFQRNSVIQVLPGRESIWNGVSQFLKNYDPPLRPELPFLPTDRRALKDLLPEAEIKNFLAGEASLYKGRGAEAEAVFAPYRNSTTPVRALANYRLGEALYLLQKYDQSLKAFQEGEHLWPQYLNLNPAATFFYGDSIVRSGDLRGGKRMLAGLITGMAEKKIAPLLLVRMGDILVRQRHEPEAIAVYRTVADNFGDNKARSHAELKLADLRFFKVDRDSYGLLANEYQRIYAESTDFAVREQALFKATLLEALYGPGSTALESVIKYERKYPKGIYVGIAKSMHEELLLAVYQELYAARDMPGLVKLAQDNRNYLARCFSDDKFIGCLAEAFAETGMLKAEIALYSNLISREWAANGVSHMFSRLLDDALALGDLDLAESAARGFLQRFPSHQAAGFVTEKLGDICYRRNNLAEVSKQLGWLLNDKLRASIPESYYYLGKALEKGRDYRGSDRALTRFIATVKDREGGSPLLADAYFSCGSARLAVGNRGKALEAFRTGSEMATDDKDRFLYKMGETTMLDGRIGEAKGYWGRLVKEGKDPLWQKMAEQSLSDLEWRTRTQGALKRVSK